MVKKEVIKDFPDAPGIYIMKDKEGEVEYVGKALSLKKRLRSYFSKQDSIKTQIMLNLIKEIEFRQTASEHDALILEAKLIKEYQPRFNTILKDDKSFPYIKITREDIPRVFIGRKRKTEGTVDYFGPYTSAKLLRRALNTLRHSFPFCTCRRPRKKPCLNYHLGLCAGPCHKKISKKGYLDIIKGLQDFLLKKDPELIEELSVKLRGLVREERFEEAARARDQLQALSLLISLKKIDAKKVLNLETGFQRLGLKKEPVRVEAFDISNIGVKFSVGSMVSFYRGKPDKNNYRRFKIKTVAGIDDYAMIREVVYRRYRRLSSEGAKMPDLIIIDGGAGHLQAAREALLRLALDIPIIAIAKSQDLLYTIRNKGPVKLAPQSGALRLIQRVRNEAHRFALNYHQLLRKKDAFG